MGGGDMQVKNQLTEKRENREKDKISNGNKSKENGEK